MTGTAAALTISSRHQRGQHPTQRRLRRPPSACPPSARTSARISVFTPTTVPAMVSPATVDYKLGDNSSIYVRGLYSHFDNFGDQWVITPTINSFTTLPMQGGMDGSMSYSADSSASHRRNWKHGGWRPT